MTTPKDRRLDKIEERLTPKEWAIREADRIRAAPSLTSATLARPSYDLNDTIHALAKDQHPGSGHDADAVRARLRLKLWADYKTRLDLLINVQSTIRERAEAASLEVALKLQTLLTMILQDSFSRTAKKAAEWVEEYKTADADEEQQRQGMLAELDAYIGVDLEAGEGPRSLDIGVLKINFPSAIQEWIDAIKALIFDVFRHQAAVTLIQDQYFDGHPILAKDIEWYLDEVIQKIRDVVARHNEYLDVRRQLFTAEWDEDDADGVRAGLAGEREGRLVIDIDKLKPSKKAAEDLTRLWVKLAKAEATVTVTAAEQGNQAAFDYLRNELKDEIGEGPLR